MKSREMLWKRNGDVYVFQSCMLIPVQPYNREQGRSMNIASAFMYETKACGIHPLTDSGSDMIVRLFCVCELCSAVYISE